MNQTEPDIGQSRKRGKVWACIATLATTVVWIAAILLFRDAANATPTHPCVVITPPPVAVSLVSGR